MCAFPNIGDYYSIKWGLLLLWCLFVAILPASLKWHWSVTFALAYFFGRAVMEINFNPHDYQDQTMVWTSASATEAALTLCLLFMAVPKLKKSALKEMVAWLCIVDTLYTAINFMVDGTLSGINKSPSMNACLIAMTIPLVNGKLRWWVRAAATVLVLMSHSSTALLCLAISFTVYCLSSWVIVTLPIGLIVIYRFISPALLDDRGRFGPWKMYLQAWGENFNHWVGSGIGSFAIFGPMFQKIANQDVKTIFVWAHNDYLQLYLEQGIIGCAVILPVLFFALKAAWKDKELLSALLCYMAVALFHYPTHFPIHAFVGMSLLTLTLRK